MELYNRAMAWFMAHPTYNALAHSAGGFGLALILQHYINGNAFLPVWIGWILVAFSAAIHLYSFMGK